MEAGSASERQRLQVPVDYDARLRRQVSVGVVAEEEGEFTLIITYGQYYLYSQRLCIQLFQSGQQGEMVSEL